MYNDLNSENVPPAGRPWNKDCLIVPKPPLKLQEIWAIHIRLQLGRRVKDLALFNLAIDSKLYCCDIVRLRIQDVSHVGRIVSRATVMQQKNNTARQIRTDGTHARCRRSVDHQDATQHGAVPVPEPIREVGSYIDTTVCPDCEILGALIGLDPHDYGTHSMRRTKATLIYRRTKNQRVIQLLLGHTKLKSTVRYLRNEVDDALEMAEQTEV